MPISAGLLPEMTTRRQSVPPISRQAITRSGLCIGCGSCAVGAPGRMGWDRYGQLKPQGPGNWRRAREASFARTCPFSPVAENEDAIAVRRFPQAQQAHPLLGRYEAAYIGYAREPGFRRDGSSGGMVTWVAAELLRRGLVDGVAHVVAVSPRAGDRRLFEYRVSRTAEALREGAKSRYYPVELSPVIEEIRAVPGRYAIVGIPCFIKAIQLRRREDALLRRRIAFTLGLYCGHMKSARMVDSFAWQMHASPADVERIDFRVKDERRPANWYRAALGLRGAHRREQDWWHLAEGDWGSGFFQNSACNFCDDVVAETADIAFGDAWIEPYSSDGRGTNVVLVRSAEVHQLVREAASEERIRLDPVDASTVVETQAAGFRQRREGLAYRLRYMHLRLRPAKRVTPGGEALPLRRKLIYRMRAAISRWSHRMFWLAQAWRWPGLYIGWAKLATSAYHALAYSRGPLGKVVDHILRNER